MKLPRSLAFLAGLAASTAHAGRLPKEFVYGCGTSAYQIEGAWNDEGKGPSIWDTFVHTRKTIGDNTTGDVAAEHYYRYKEDVNLYREAGIDHYAFTISWPRILPKGRGEVNEKGLQFYSNLVDELLSKGIQPIATLYHWDCPQALDDEYGCFLDEKIVEDFTEYARVVFSKLGDRVKFWVTMNEPAIFCNQGYRWGDFAPGRCSDRSVCPEGDSTTEPYLCGHNALNAHAAVVNLYRTEFKNKPTTPKDTKIGLILDGSTSFPLNEGSTEDKEAAEREMTFFFGWIANPIWIGDYPAAMREAMGDRLPKFTKKQKELLLGSADYFAWDAYTSQWASFGPDNGKCKITDPRWPSCVEVTQQKAPEKRNVSLDKGQYIGTPSHSSWLFSVPEGLSRGLEWIQSTYNPPSIYITENGVPVPSESQIPLDQLLNDAFRVEFHNGYLREMQVAIDKGIKVDGYVAWSCLDNFEWNEGLDTRFGIIHVDYETQKRTLKRSAYYLKDYFHRNRA